MVHRYTVLIIGWWTLQLSHSSIILFLTTPKIRAAALPFCQWNSFMCIPALPGSELKKKKKAPWNKYIFRKIKCACIFFPLNSINKTFIKRRYDHCNYLKALQTHATQFNLLFAHIFNDTSFFLPNYYYLTCHVSAALFELFTFCGFMAFCIVFATPVQRPVRAALILYKLWVVVNQYRKHTVKISDCGNGRDVQPWSIQK